MGRNGITYNQVADAAVKITAQSHLPTIDRIREHLGTGSKSTIAKYLQQWRALHNELKPYQSPETNTIPKETLAHVKGLMDHLRHEANNKIEKAEAHFQTELKALETKLIDEKSINQQLYQNLQALTEKNQQQATKITQVEAALHKLRGSEIRLEERLTGSQHTLENQLAENKRLHQHLESLEKNLKHYQEAIQQQRQQQTLEIENQRQRFEQAIQLEKAENKEIQKSLEQAKQNLLVANSEIAALNSSTQLLETKISHIDQSLSEKIRAINALNDKLSTRDNDIKIANQEICNLNQKLINQINENKQLIIDLNASQQENNKFEGKIATLTEANAKLTQVNATLENEKKRERHKG